MLPRARFGFALLVASVFAARAPGFCAQNDPARNEPEYWLAQASARIEKGDDAAAVASLRRAEEMNLTPEESRRAAELYESARDYCRAADIARRLVAQVRVEGHWGEYALDADAAAFCGRRDEAVAALDALTRSEPPDQLQEEAAYLFLYLDEDAKSLRASDRYLQRNAGDLWHWFRRFEAAVGTGNREQASAALDHIRRVLDAPPSPALRALYARLETRLEYYRVQWILTWPSSHPGRDDWARGALAAQAPLALRALAQAEQSVARDSDASLHLGMLYHELGDERRSWAILASRRDASSGDASRTISLARASMRARDFKTAREAAGKALALAGDDKNALAQVAALYADLDDCRAVSLYDSLIKDDARTAALFIARARVAGRCGGRERELADLRRAAELSRAPEELLAIALLYQDARAFDAELTLLSRLVADSPGSAALLGDLGVAQFLAGREQSAVQSLEKALALDPALTSAYVSLGTIYEGQNRFAEAAALYDRALATAPSDAALEKRLIESRRQARAAMRRPR